MNRKLRVLMLSLAVVMFAVSSVFALTVEFDYDYTDAYTDTVTAGRNYSQRVIATLDDSYHEAGPVKWEFEGLDWLSVRSGDNDTQIYLEGAAPSTAGTLNIKVKASVSGDVEVESGDETVTVTGTISGWLDNEEEETEYEITIDADETTQLNASCDLTSYTLSGDAKALEIVRTGYSVLIEFKTSKDLETIEYEYDEVVGKDEYGDDITETRYDSITRLHAVRVLAQVEPDYIADYINLPSWLSYRIVDTQYEYDYVYDDESEVPDADGTGAEELGDGPFVKTLEIYYNNPAVEPSDGAGGAVRILGADFYTFTRFDGEGHDYDVADDYPDGATIGWTLQFQGTQFISLNKTEATINPVYPNSADLTVSYVNQHVEGLIFSPDISASVTLTAAIASSDSEEPSGTITITATPKIRADAVYSTDMIVTDAEGGQATMSLIISVDVPSIKLSADYIYLSSLYGDSDDVSIAYTAPNPIGYKTSTTVSDDFDLTVTSDDEAKTITVSIKPVDISGEWEGTLTILDEYGKSADIPLRLKVFASGDIGIDIVSGDVPLDGIKLIKGDSASYTLAPKSNASLSWVISGDYVSYLTVVSTDKDIILTINTGSADVGTYTVDVIAKDSSGNQAGSYTFTWTVEPFIVLESETAILRVIYPSSASLDVTYASQDIAATDSVIFSPDISGSVSLDFVVTPANTSDDFGGTITITATPLILDDAQYSTVMTVTDINGKTAEMTLTVSVDVPSIVLSENTVSLSAEYLNSAEESVRYSGPKPVGYEVSVSDDFGLTVTSDDETITIAITPAISADWTGTLTILDEYGKSADIALSLIGYVSGDISITADTDISEGVTTLEGDSATYVLSALNTYRNITWNVSGGYPEGSVTWNQVNNTLTLVIEALEGIAGTYNVTVTATDESGRTAGSYAFTWTVKPHITLSYDVDTISVDYGSSADLVVYYSKQEAKTVTFPPDDLSEDVRLTATIISDNGTEPGGKIVLHAVPVKPYMGIYNTNLIVTDTEGYEASMKLNISVDVGEFVITPESASIVVAVGKSEDVSFSVTGHNGVVEWDYGTLSSGFRLDSASVLNATEYNTTKSYTVTGVLPGSFSADITATDEASRYVSAVLYVDVVSGEVSIVEVASGDAIPDDLTINIGTSERYMLTVGNAYKNVEWSVVADLNSGLSYDIDGNTISLIFNTLEAVAGKYTATITAVDDSGRTAEKTISWTVRQPLELSFDISEISVDLGSSVDVSIEYYYQNPVLVSFDDDEISSDIEISYEVIPDDMADGTPHGTIVVSFRPITPLETTYTTEMTITDGDGYTESLVLDVDVNVGSLDITPESADVSIMVGESDNVAFSVSGFSGSISWDMSDIPSGITLIGNETSYAATYTITGVTAGTYSFDVTVTDSRDETATATVYVTVRATPPVQPVITISPDKQSVVVAAGASREVTFTAPTHSGDVRWATGTVPTGITLANSNNGTFTVTGVTTGTYSVDITASDTTGVKHATLNVEVVNRDPVQPVITISPDKQSVVVAAGASREVSFTAPTHSGDVTWATGTVPTGIRLVNSNNGTFTVTGVTAGTYSVDITATDTTGTRHATLNVEVTNPAPVQPVLQISPDVASVTVAVGASENVSFTATTHSGDVRWAAGTVPAGIRLVNSNNGTFTVTGVTAGTYSVDITASDATGSRHATIRATVTAAPAALTLSQPSVSRTIARGASSDVSFSATNASGTVTWTVGATPAGITITSNGNGRFTVVVAQTATIGNHSVTITATDAARRTATGTITVTVTAPVVTQLSLSPATANASVRAGASATVSFSATNASGTVTWTVGTLPSGVTVTSNGNGSFTVTADSTATAGSYTVTITATDGAGRTATGTISITVTAQGALSISPSTTSIAAVAGGASSTASFTAVNSIGAVTWSAGSTPAGVTVTNNGGNFTITAGASATAGSYTVTVTASDTAGRMATAIITLSVEVREAGNTEPARVLDDTTLERVADLVDDGALVTVTDPVTGEEKVEIPSDAIDYTPQGDTDPTAKTLSKEDTTEVKQGEAINPVKLVLEFPVDIWRIYINGELVAWAYSPTFGGGEYVAGSEFAASERSSNGVTIKPQSRYEADVTFETSEMPAGNNEIETAFVEDVNNPTQEIGKTTLATVEVEVEASDTPTPIPSTSGDVGVGAAGGGCSAGLGAMVSALAAAFFISRKRS